MSRIERKSVTIPTYPIGKAEPLPLFFEKRPYQGASGKLYPIPYITSFSDDKIDKEYDGITLENKYISVLLLPEIGGKIHSALDKTTGYDFVYHNKVIKPAMVGLGGPWVSGGIEFNWPQHHRPTTFMPLQVATGCEGGEAFAYMGEMDYFHNMKGDVKISVDDNHSYIKATVTVYNPTTEAHPFMWWANLAVEVNEDYKVVFPPDVEFVNDHDRRAVLEWPIAKGVYKTARPFDYGDGVDIHSFPAVKVPCSFLVSKGQSDADFVSGYDAGRECGIVTVANHHIAPGKKLWTWGDSNFGAKWCSNLTDDGSKYVELMTGCYTDNQPDFTWIAPGETKVFEQFWYPIRDIGEIKSATIEGACNLERRDNGIYVGVYTTSGHSGAKISVKANGKEIYSAVAEVSPEKTFSAVIPDACGKLSMTVTDANGNAIVSYTEHVRGNKKPIAPRQPALPPKDIPTVEELYLNGAHLVQYKHFAYRPEDYFAEGLRRDAGDARCNTEMGKIRLRHGQFTEAIEYFSAAIDRLTLRNPNPYDTEAYYLRALCYFNTDDLENAYDDAYRAVWSYPQRSAGYALLAKIEAKRGDTDECVRLLKLSLETNSENLMVKYVLGLLTGDGDIEAKISSANPLFFAGITNEKDALFFADELLSYGLVAEAEKILLASTECAMKYYYLAECARKNGNTADEEAYIAKADSMPWQCEFPSKKENIKVLKNANTPKSSYYLGSLLYNFERYNEACAEFDKCISAIDFAPAYRNLALGLFDHLGQPERARVCLEKALELYPESDRIFYELTQMYKSMNLPLAERIALFEKYPELVAKRDDCTLAYSVLLTVAGEYEKANAVLLSHRFHTYEGGEGNLTCHHAWLHLLMGMDLMKSGEYEQARATLESGLTFPENYGEEKNYFVNDAPLYYCLAECESKLGNAEAADNYLALADTTHGVPTVHSIFQCMALKKANNPDRAAAIAKEMCAMGQAKIDRADINDYYGVGAPAYPPFGYDIVKAHTLQGNTLLAFGALAEGRVDDAKKYAQAISDADLADFHAYFFNKVLTVI